MKSFKEYLSEDDIQLNLTTSRADANEDYKKYAPRNPDLITSNSDIIKSFTHKGKKYHLFQTRDEDLKEKVFSVMHEDETNKLKDVGSIEVASSDEKQLIQDRVQTQLGRTNDSIRLEPMFDSEHTGSGLVSRVYKMIAKHHKVDLISDHNQTRGSQNIWSELARSGKVTGVHSRRKFEPFMYNPKNQNHVNTIYDGGLSTLLHYPHEGRVTL